MFPVLATGASRHVLSGHLELEGSSKDERQELEELVFPCTSFLKDFFMMSVQTSKCTTYNEALGNFWVAILVAVATGQMHYGRASGGRALGSRSSYA